MDLLLSAPRNRSHYVTVLQIGLYAHGYELTNGMDSSFGASTEYATIAYQMEVGINPNGRAGIDTFSHLAGVA